MAKHKIIIAETDPEYVIPLELRFLEELPSDTELEVITEPEYFRSFFAQPVNAEILIVSRELYSPELKKHSFKRIFVLTEADDAPDEPDGTVQNIYKYTSLRYIYSQVMFSLTGDAESGEAAAKETQVIVVHSAIGGAGKTSVAMGLCGCLTQNFRKVLFIDAEYVQDAHFFFRDGSAVPTEVITKARLQGDNMFQLIRPYCRHEMFDYLPPFRGSLSAMNLSYSFYLDLIRNIKATRQYDDIVVDTDSIFDTEKNALLSAANRVVLITMQDAYSAMKTDVLLNCADLTDDSKFMFVCNRFQSDRPNALLDSSGRYMISSYIGQTDMGPVPTVERLTAVGEIQRIALDLL